MNKIILLSNSRTALVAVQIYLSGIISITLAQEMSPEVLERVRSASVEIHIKGQLRGGGAIVTNTEGKPYVVTAAHLFLDPKDTCLLITHDGESHFGSLTTYDLGHDLALLEVPPGLKQYGHLSIATRLPRETQAVFNLGPALRRRTLVLSGHVADIRNSFTDFTSSKGHISHYFVAGINPVLTSGGAWVNRDGEIVGVQHGRLIGDQGAPSSGLSMVSPPSAIRELLEAKKIASTPG
ncbi:MAG: serine protease, partial [Verrucomicrobiota bacterium]